MEQRGICMRLNEDHVHACVIGLLATAAVYLHLPPTEELEAAAAV